MDTRKFVPYGDNLRTFANQSIVPVTDLKYLLKGRGIFVGNMGKIELVPFLQNTILTPSEFDTLVENVRTKEDTFKQITKQITLTPECQFLFNPNLSEIDVKGFVQKQLPNCRLNQGKLRFLKEGEDKNQIKLDFEIDRMEFNKSWEQRHNRFQGKVLMKKDNNQCYITLLYTSKETREIGNQIVRQQICKYKKGGYIDDRSDAKSILFKDFSNEKRFAFFYSLTSKMNSDYFQCKDIKDMSVRPADDAALNDEIEWMVNLKKLLLNGQSVNKVFFLKEKKYHKNILIWKVVSLFEYHYNGEKGDCVLEMEVADFDRNGDESEFEMSVSAINPKNRLTASEKNKLKNILLRLFEEKKNIIYNSLK